MQENESTFYQPEGYAGHFVSTTRVYKFWEYDKCFKECNAFFKDNVGIHQQIKIEYRGKEIVAILSRRLKEQEFLVAHGSIIILKNIIHEGTTDYKIATEVKMDADRKVIDVLVNSILELSKKIEDNPNESEEKINSWKAQIKFARRELYSMINK